MIIIKTETLKLNDVQTIYSLGQCTEDMSSLDCNRCLGDMITFYLNVLKNKEEKKLLPSLEFFFVNFCRDH